MRLTQGCFSFLPDLTDQQIEKQIKKKNEKKVMKNNDSEDEYEFENGVINM